MRPESGTLGSKGLTKATQLGILILIRLSSSNPSVHSWKTTIPHFELKGVKERSFAVTCGPAVSKKKKPCPISILKDKEF